MAKMNVRKGDTVEVIAGKDKGARGEVIRAYPKKGRVVVEKVNIIKKAMRPTQQNPQGGISSMEAAIEASNVMLVCPSCQKATRIGHRFDDANKKHHCLFPFVDLPEEEKVCDRNISLEALRFILAEGFNILPVPCSSSEIKNNTNN